MISFSQEVILAAPKELEIRIIFSIRLKSTIRVLFLINQIQQRSMGMILLFKMVRRLQIMII